MAVKDYEEAKKRAGDFVRTFAVKPTDGTKEFVYSDQIVSITRRKQVALYVNMDHVKTHDEELHAAIEGNTLRYQKIFAEAIDDYIEELRGGEEVSLYCNLAMKVKLLVLANGYGCVRRVHLPTSVHGSSSKREADGRAVAK